MNQGIGRMHVRMKAMVVPSVLGVSEPLQTKQANLLFVSPVKSPVITAQLVQMLPPVEDHPDQKVGLLVVVAVLWQANVSTVVKPAIGAKIVPKAAVVAKRDPFHLTTAEAQRGAGDRERPGLNAAEGRRRSRNLKLPMGTELTTLLDNLSCPLTPMTHLGPSG